MSCNEKKIQISNSDESAIDRDFERIRNRFDAEMRRMEDEMSRFRGSLMDHSRHVDSHSLSPSSRRREMDSFVNSFESPLICESSDGKVLKLKFDLTEYKPEEIVVKTIDNKLQVRIEFEFVCPFSVVIRTTILLDKQLTSPSLAQTHPNITNRSQPNTRSDRTRVVSSASTTASSFCPME